MIKIAISSQDSVKIKSTQRAFDRTFGRCDFIAISVSPGIPKMPMSFEEFGWC